MKIYRAYPAGVPPTEQKPHITVFLSDEALSKTPDQRKKAQWLASEFQRIEIANDADFKSGRWQMVVSSGAKVWYN
jgi:hypothetical protein